MSRLSSTLEQLPIRTVKTELYLGNCFKLISDDDKEYLLRHINDHEKHVYYGLEKNTDNLLLAMGEYDNYLLFQLPKEKGEEKALAKNLFTECVRIFNNSKESIVLKKSSVKKLQSVYQVLDDRFRYMELRVREIEMKDTRTDPEWVILSKYKLILQVKMKLYDLQQKMFKMIDEELSIHYGIIMPKPNVSLYRSEKFIEQFDAYNGPISSLLARFYVENDHLDSFKKEIRSIIEEDNSEFEKTNFCFLVFYIYILSLNMPRMLDNHSIANFLSINKRIIQFHQEYKDYLE